MKRTSLSALALLVLVPLASGQDGKLNVTVKETAGIRRFGYPVAAKLELHRAAVESDRFRLLLDNKPVPAQFRVLADKKTVALDFTVNQGPFEKQSFTVEYGPKVEE